MSYQKPGSLKFGVDPYRLKEVFKSQCAPCPRAFWDLAISCCEESPARRPETDQIITRLQQLYSNWSEAESMVHKFIPQKDGAKLWLSLIISVDPHPLLPFLFSMRHLFNSHLLRLLLYP